MCAMPNRRRYCILAVSILAFLSSALSVFPEEPNKRLRLSDGRILRDYQIASTTEWNALIVHSGGVDEVPLDFLPPDLQRQLGFSEKKATQARSERAKALAEKKAEKEKEQRDKGRAVRILHLVGANSLEAHLTVFQVTSEGYLADGFAYPLPEKTVATYEKVLRRRSALDPSSGHYVNDWVRRQVREKREFDDLVFIVDNNIDQISKGDRIIRRVYPSGTLTYENLIGGERIVLKFTTAFHDFLKTEHIDAISVLSNDEIIKAIEEGYENKEEILESLKDRQD